MSTAIVRRLRAEIATREAGHPATPPPPPRVGIRIAAWAEAHEVRPEILARAAQIPLPRLRSIWTGSTPTVTEAQALALAIDDADLIRAAADERLRSPR